MGPARRRVAAVADPLAGALVLAAFFDGISDNWVHATLLAAAAAAVWHDRWLQATGAPRRPSVPLLPERPADGSRRRRTAATLAAAAVYCLVVGGWGIYTWPTTVAIIVPAAVWLALGWRGPLRARAVPAPLRRRSIVLWGAVLVAGGLWELQALLQQPDIRVGSADHPTISYLMDSVLASHAGRTVTLAAWLAIGYGLMAVAPWNREPAGPSDRGFEREHEAHP